MALPCGTPWTAASTQRLSPGQLSFQASHLSSLSGTLDQSEQHRLKKDEKGVKLITFISLNDVKCFLTDGLYQVHMVHKVPLPKINGELRAK